MIAGVLTFLLLPSLASAASASSVDTLSVLLSAMPAAPCSGGGRARLECASRRAQAAASALELFAGGPPSAPARGRAADLVARELEPWFSDRDASLGALYRTLAVLDESVLLRQSGGCRARERREALLSSADGLFADPKTGKVSAWLERLLGPVSAGRAASSALDTGSGLSPSAADYARLRARERALTLALVENPEDESSRCERSRVYEKLAAAHRGRGRAGLTEGPDDAAVAASVALLVGPGASGLAAYGAGVVVAGPRGARLVTDAGAALDPATGKPWKGLSAIFLQDGRLLAPVPVTISRWDVSAGLAEGPAPQGVAGAGLADDDPRVGSRVEILAQGRGTGLWGRTLGLVRREDGVRFETDAALEGSQRGGAVVDEDGKLAGVLTRGSNGMSGVTAGALRRWLSGAKIPAAAGRSANSGSAQLSQGLVETGYTTQVDCYGSTSYIPELGQTIHSVCVENCGCAPPPAAPAPTPARPSMPARPAGPDWAQTFGAQMGGMLGQYLGNQLGQFLFGGPRVYAPPVAAAPPPPPAPPPKPARPQDQRKITGLSLTIDPERPAPGQTARVTAQLRFNGDDYEDKANVDITLTAPAGTTFLEPMGEADQAGDAQVGVRTDAAGSASRTLRLNADADMGRALEVSGVADTEDGRFSARVSLTGKEGTGYRLKLLAVPDHAGVGEAATIRIQLTAEDPSASAAGKTIALVFKTPGAEAARLGTAEVTTDQWGNATVKVCPASKIAAAGGASVAAGHELSKGAGCAAVGAATTIAVTATAYATAPGAAVFMTPASVEADVLATGVCTILMNAPAIAQAILESTAKSETCEDLRAAARSACSDERNCGEGSECEDMKAVRKSLIGCQRAWRKVKDKCGTDEDEASYEKITSRVEKCGGLIAKECCPDWTAELDQQKDAACKAGRCSGTDPCSMLISKMSGARLCLKLREQQTQACFDGETDVGHGLQESQVQTMIVKCLGFISAYAGKHGGEECLETSPGGAGDGQ